MTFLSEKGQFYTTVADNQLGVLIHVFVGERATTKGYILLGEYHLDGIAYISRRPSDRGDTDSNSILNLSARGKSTGKFHLDGISPNPCGVHEVVLVGASTRTFKVQSMIKVFINGKVSGKFINPYEAVALAWPCRPGLRTTAASLRIPSCSRTSS